MTPLPIVAFVQVSMVIGATLLVATCLRRRSAATKHWVLVVGVCSAIAVVPMSVVSSYWLPASWRATGPGHVSGPGVATSAKLDSDARSDDVRAPRDTIDSVWVGSNMAGKAATVDELRTPTLTVWAAGSLLAFAVLFAGLVRLTRLTSQSTLVLWRSPPTSPSIRA